MFKVLRGNILFTKVPQKFEVYENSYLIVKNGKVDKICSELSNDITYENVIDYRDKLIIPGMNDLHCHAPQYRNLGKALDKELLPWLNSYTFPEEAKYKDTNYAKKMYTRFIKDIWKYGTTRASVFSTIHKDSTLELMELFEKVGLGAYVGKVNMNMNCPNDLLEDTKKSVEDTEYIILKYSKKDSLVNPIITPRFIPSCTSELLKVLGELAIKYNTPCQSHLSENLSEIEWVKSLEPNSKFYGDAYNNYNLFGQTPTLMAHCVYSTDEEIELIKKNNVIVVHCPNSNYNVGSGISQVRKLLNYGVKVALGSDISGGHTLSMFNTIISAIQSSKIWWVNSDKKFDFLSLSEAFYMATKCGGSFFGNVGSFEKNYDFDAIIIDDSKLNYDNYSLLERIERFIYLGDDRNIIARYVKGKLINEPFK